MLDLIGTYKAGVCFVIDFIPVPANGNQGRSSLRSPQARTLRLVVRSGSSRRGGFIAKDDIPMVWRPHREADDPDRQ